MKTYGEEGTDFSLNDIVETSDSSAYVFTGNRVEALQERLLVGKINTSGEVEGAVASGAGVSEGYSLLEANGQFKVLASN